MFLNLDKVDNVILNHLGRSNIANIEYVIIDNPTTIKNSGPYIVYYGFIDCDCQFTYNGMASNYRKDNSAPVLFDTIEENGLSVFMGFKIQLKTPKRLAKTYLVTEPFEFCSFPEEFTCNVPAYTRSEVIVEDNTVAIGTQFFRDKDFTTPMSEGLYALYIEALDTTTWMDINSEGYVIIHNCR